MKIYFLIFSIFFFSFAFSLSESEFWANRDGLKIFLDLNSSTYEFLSINKKKKTKIKLSFQKLFLNKLISIKY